MSENRPWKRITGAPSARRFCARWGGSTALALWAGLLVCCIAIPAAASPIYPNIKKLVSESQKPPVTFAPARAGWDGSEMPPTLVGTDLDAAAVLRANKAALLNAAIPDLRAVFGVFLVIVLMRLLRRIQEDQQRQLATVTPIGAPLPAPEERKVA